MLLIDDNEDQRVSTKALVKTWSTEGAKYEVTDVSSFGSTLPQLEGYEFGQAPYDVVLLDIANGNDGNDRTGLRVLEEIKKRLFVEVIIYSAHAKTPQVTAAQGPSVATVGKGDLVELRLALERAVSSKALGVRNLLSKKVLEQLRSEEAEYLWEFARKHTDFYESSSPDVLATNLARRLSVQLAVAGASSEPHHFYIRPPILEHLLGGDIFRGRILPFENMAIPFAWCHDGYWVTVSASCDLERPDPESQVVLAVATLLDDAEELKKWRTDPDRYGGEFSSFLNNQKDLNRHVLPEWLDIPALVVDFERTVAVPSGILFDSVRIRKKVGKKDTLKDKETQTLQKLDAAGFTLERVASLMSPYGEHLTNRYSRKYGRIGVAALNTAPVMDALKLAGPGANAVAAAQEIDKGNLGQ